MPNGTRGGSRPCCRKRHRRDAHQSRRLGARNGRIADPVHSGSAAVHTAEGVARRGIHRPTLVGTRGCLGDVGVHSGGPEHHQEGSGLLVRPIHAGRRRPARRPPRWTGTMALRGHLGGSAPQRPLRRPRGSVIAIPRKRFLGRTIAGTRRHRAVTRWLAVSVFSRTFDGLQSRPRDGRWSTSRGGG